MASEPGKVGPIPEDAFKLVDANTVFAFDLYKLETANKDGNIFISPLSACVALAMTDLGARGNTLSEMNKVLHFDEMNEVQLHPLFAELLDALKVTDSNCTLHLANCLFGEKGHKFLDEFFQLSKLHYKSELASTGFVEDAAMAAAQINQWVAENTNRKIKDIIGPNDISPLTRLVLVNAIYFKGDWMKKFDEGGTIEADFFTSSSESKKVMMMRMKKSKFNYGSDPVINCQVLELPYVNSVLSMFILLPDNTVSNLKELEAKLSAEHLTNVEKIFSMSNREVSIWVPRFKLDERLEMDKILPAMGMKDLFDPTAADLSGMDGTRELYVSKVLHRAYIEVNEEGSEAAAATAVAVNRRCAVLKDFEFRADHPFLFFIRHNITKSILFLGRLVKP